MFFIENMLYLFEWQCLVSSQILIAVVFFVCSISLVEEDRYDSYSRMILKYFLAEGVVCRHELFVATAEDNPDDILQVREDAVHSIIS